MKRPQHWQDSGNAVSGLWLVCSPWLLAFQNDRFGTGNAIIVGVLLLAISLRAIWVPGVWAAWIQTALGLWLAFSPWVLALEDQTARACAVVTGLVVLTLALWTLQDYGAKAAENMT